MIALLRRRNFALLWFGGLISLSGDWILIVGLPIYVYQLTGSTLATGLMFLVSRVPSLLLGSLAGVLADRWDRRRIVIFVNLLLAIGLLPLVLVHTISALWIVYAVAFAESCLTQLFRPAEQALLPTLVDPADLGPANALNALNGNLARLVGPALGGAVATVFGLAGVALFDAASFAVAGTLTALIRIAIGPAAGAPAETPPPLSWPAVWREWVAGLRLVRQSRPVAVVFLVVAITGFGEGILGTLLAPFVSKILRGGAPEIGWLMGAQAVGGLVGSLVIGRVSRRIAPGPLMGASGVLFGLIDLAIFNYPAFYPDIRPALVLMVLVGLPAVGFSVTLFTLLQSAVPPAYRGRVFGAFGTTTALVGLLGTILAGGWGDVVGILPLLNFQGFGYMLAGVLTLVFLGRSAARVAEDSAPTDAVATPAGTR